MVTKHETLLHLIIIKRIYHKQGVSNDNFDIFMSEKNVGLKVKI